MGRGFGELSLEEQRIAGVKMSLGVIWLKAQGGQGMWQRIRGFALTEEQAGQVAVRRCQVRVEAKRFVVLRKGLADSLLIR